MKKPKNMRNVLADENGLYGLGPYVYLDVDDKPLRVTLDGEFGVQDIEWILYEMKRDKKMTEIFEIKNMIDEVNDMLSFLDHEYKASPGHGPEFKNEISNVIWCLRVGKVHLKKAVEALRGIEK